jgi:hypothetical protein
MFNVNTYNTVVVKVNGQYCKFGSLVKDSHLQVGKEVLHFLHGNALLGLYTDARLGQVDYVVTKFF